MSEMREYKGNTDNTDIWETGGCVDDTERRQYAYWLCSIPGIGNQTIAKLLEVCGGTPEKVYQASEKQWHEVLNSRQLESIRQVTAEWNPEDEYQKMAAQGIALLLQEDAAYPKRLLNIPDAPYGLFYKGRLPVEHTLSVAIIGARDCSSYGTWVARELGKYLGEKGIQIISGMARGIDGISQEAALQAGGASFGVLGCGVDICYPAQNQKLYERLLAGGGILSTYPPGTLPKPQNFPPRNRIVSGLADVVVVIEARQKSGTLITVDMALEQGKEVYVVPGRITDRLSDGCNSLIKQGAGVLLCPQDFLEEIYTTWEEQRKGAADSKDRNQKKERTEIQKTEIQKTEIKKTEMQKTEIQKTEIQKAEIKKTEIQKTEIQKAEIQKTEIQQIKMQKTGKEKHKEKAETDCIMPHITLPPELREVYEILDFYPQSIEQIRGKLPESYTQIQVNTTLIRLCMEDLAIQLSPGYFCLK